MIAGWFPYIFLKDWKITMATIKTAPRATAVTTSGVIKMSDFASVVPTYLQHFVFTGYVDDASLSASKVDMPNLVSYLTGALQGSIGGGTSPSGSLGLNVVKKSTESVWNLALQTGNLYVFDSTEYNFPDLTLSVSVDTSGFGGTSGKSDTCYLVVYGLHKVTFTGSRPAVMLTSYGSFDLDETSITVYCFVGTSDVVYVNRGAYSVLESTVREVADLTFVAEGSAASSPDSIPAAGGVVKYSVAPRSMPVSDLVVLSDPRWPIEYEFDGSSTYTLTVPENKSGLPLSLRFAVSTDGTSANASTTWFTQLGAASGSTGTVVGYGPAKRIGEGGSPVVEIPYSSLLVPAVHEGAAGVQLNVEHSTSVTIRKEYQSTTGDLVTVSPTDLDGSGPTQISIMVAPDTTGRAIMSTYLDFETSQGTVRLYLNRVFQSA